MISRPQRRNDVPDSAVIEEHPVEPLHELSQALRGARQLIGAVADGLLTKRLAPQRAVDPGPEDFDRLPYLVREPVAKQFYRATHGG